MTAILAVIEGDSIYIAADTQTTSGDYVSRGSKFVDRLGWVFAWAGGSGVASWLLYDASVAMALVDDSAKSAYQLSIEYKLWKDADKEVRESNLLAVSPSGLAFEIFDGSICPVTTCKPVAYGAPSAVLGAYAALKDRDDSRCAMDAVIGAIEAVCSISLYCGLPVETRVIRRISP